MDTDFFKELERFTLLVRKRVSTAYSGGRKSMRFGHGISPVGYREYRKGDDFKLVDWKVYGRTEKLFIREHEEERSLVVHILLDSSASMSYSGKYAYASRLAAGFAYLATMENEKYTLSRFCHRFYPGEPKRGRRNPISSIAMLDDTLPRGRTNLKLVSELFASQIKTTSLVVLISDLLEDTEDVITSIFRLSGHELVVIQVLSPDEMGMGFGGDVKFVDMESGLSVITRVTEGERADYQTRLAEHNEKIREACDQVGANYFLFQTDRPIFDAFSEMLTRAVVWKT
jgi:uncharacterized protein (DUF58 family)